MLGEITSCFPSLGDEPQHYSMRPPSPFGQKMLYLLGQASISVADFRRKEDIKSSTWTQVISGVRRPNPGEVQQWLTALGVSPTERSKVLELAMSTKARAKADVGDYVKRLEARISRLERSQKAEHSQLRLFSQILLKDGVQLPKQARDIIRALVENIDAEDE